MDDIRDEFAKESLKILLNDASISMVANSKSAAYVSGMTDLCYFIADSMIKSRLKIN